MRIIMANAMIKAVRGTARWVRRILEVSVPMGAVNGLRTR